MPTQQPNSGKLQQINKPSLQQCQKQGSPNETCTALDTDPPENLNKLEMKTSRDEVYAAIDGERDYQDVTWTNDKTVGEEVAILAFYSAGAMAKWVENKGDAEALRFVRKVAGIAVRCMENHGAPKR